MAPTLDTIEFQLHLLFEHETVNGFLRDYYWIGFIAETLSAREKALDAYRRAAEADPGFAPVCAEKEQMLSDGASELRLPVPALHALSVFERNVAQIVGNGS